MRRRLLPASLVVALGCILVGCSPSNGPDPVPPSPRPSSATGTKEDWQAKLEDVVTSSLAEMDTAPAWSSVGIVNARTLNTRDESRVGFPAGSYDVGVVCAGEGTVIFVLDFGAIHTRTKLTCKSEGGAISVPTVIPHYVQKASVEFMADEDTNAVTGYAISSTHHG